MSYSNPILGLCSRDIGLCNPIIGPVYPIIGLGNPIRSSLHQICNPTVGFV